MSYFLRKPLWLITILLTAIVSIGCQQPAEEEEVVIDDFDLKSPTLVTESSGQILLQQNPLLSGKTLSLSDSLEFSESSSLFESLSLNVDTTCTKDQQSLRKQSAIPSKKKLYIYQFIPFAIELETSGSWLCSSKIVFKNTNGSTKTIHLKHFNYKSSPDFGELTPLNKTSSKKMLIPEDFDDETFSINISKVDSLELRCADFSLEYPDNKSIPHEVRLSEFNLKQVPDKMKTLVQKCRLTAIHQGQIIGFSPLLKVRFFNQYALHSLELPKHAFYHWGKRTKLTYSIMELQNPNDKEIYITVPKKIKSAISLGFTKVLPREQKISGYIKLNTDLNIEPDLRVGVIRNSKHWIIRMPAHTYFSLISSFSFNVRCGNKIIFNGVDSGKKNQNREAGFRFSSKQVNVKQIINPKAKLDSDNNVLRSFSLTSKQNFWLPAKGSNTAPPMILIGTKDPRWNCIVK